MCDDVSYNTEANESERALPELLAAIRACRVCRDEPRYGAPLPHEPRPVVQASGCARICIASQAPGARVHASGRPYTDASGVRLRSWLGISEADFYNPDKVAIVPMGFCFPGNDTHGGDLPPRRECAEIWHASLFERLPRIELMIVVGMYAQAWHLGGQYTSGGLTQTVENWRTIRTSKAGRRTMPLPHPSWRNTGWLKQHPWFEEELLPVLREDVDVLLDRG